MFYIGDWDKKKILTHYLEHNDINFVVVVHSNRLGLRDYEIPIKHEYIEWHQTIMYKNYYRLMQLISKNTLIVCDEILVNQNRYQLEYNCINNFINQTPHRLVFNYLPFIDTTDDFMILLDFYNSNMYKGEPFRWQYLKDINLHIKPVKLDIEFEDVSLTDTDKEQYAKKREALFESIGLRDPDTIPRQLALVAGDLRSKYISSTDKYTARNMRNKKLNVTTYKDDELHTILDLPTKRIELVHLLEITRASSMKVLTSDLPIDKYYRKQYEEWLEKLGEFYDKETILRG